MTDEKQQGIRDVSKFWGFASCGQMWFLPQIWRLCCCLPAPLLFGFWGLVQVPFDDSKSRHELLSESAWPDACTLWAGWHVPAETGPAGCSGEALVDVEKMAYWEESRGEQLVCAHTSSHDVTEHYRLPEKSSESESSVWLSAIFLCLCPVWWYKSTFLHQSVLITDSVRCDVFVSSKETCVCYIYGIFGISVTWFLHAFDTCSSNLAHPVKRWYILGESKLKKKPY